MIETLVNQHWHQLPAADAADLLGVDRDAGLTDAEAASRLAAFGLNRVTSRKERRALTRFLLQFHQPLVYILLGAGAVTAALEEAVDASVIVAVVVINAIVGFVQEARAAGLIDALARAVRTEATVVRGGARRRIPSEDLVPGDVVFVQSGDQVPADSRIVAARDLRVSEASLTGESLPVEKQADVLAGDRPLADRTNMLYASGLVTYGQAKGIVVATGDRTEIGRVSRLMSEAESLATPLTRQIGRFSAVLLVVILALAVATFLVGFLRGEPTAEMLLAAVALSVGAIPEGLPAAVTITLAIGVSRMARRRAIVRRLPAVETLGSTTVICSDKTGTLTENQMTVQAVVAGGIGHAVTGAGYDPRGRIADARGIAVTAADAPALAECLRAGLLCNDAHLVAREDRWQVDGDPTEGALVVSAAKGGLDADAERATFRRLDAVPFESDRQYMATLHSGRDGSRVAYLKGAVEAVLARACTALDADGAARPLDHDAVHAAAEELAARAFRVLAFARFDLPGRDRVTPEDVAAGGVFLGLQAMIDPPRDEAIEAVAACQRAGIAVKMITGDHAATAAAIAERVGLYMDVESGGRSRPVVTGRDLGEVAPGDLPDVAERTAVFARVTPEQKLQLVEALQSRGHVVAMTGDGVNDGPALKRSDIGIAMGRSGTEVAREAAAIVLTDDNFATIRAAVEEGRAIFDNLTRFIAWTLPTNLGEGLVILVAVFLAVPQPILPLQILWINMTTAVLLGLTLAFERKEAGLMDRPPRDPRAPILSALLVRRILMVGVLLLGASFTLFEIEIRRGAPLAEARTVAVNVFVAIETAYLFNCRSLTRAAVRTGVGGNRWLIGGVLAMWLLQLAFVYAPSMHKLFASAPIGAASWSGIAAAAVVSFAIVEIEKAYERRRFSRAGGGR